MWKRKSKREDWDLIVNRAEPAQAERITINSRVASGAVRRETRNGKDYFVVSARTLPFNVIMNGGLYPREQIEANYAKLDGTLAPLGHPMKDGQPISAFSPEGINQTHVGAWNENARIEGNRVSLDKVIDIEVAQRTENGRTLLERLEQLSQGQGEPIHTSVAVLCQRLPAPTGARGYSWVANIMDMDHDAILLDEPGAVTPEQGVGLAVNADEAATLEPNADALVGLSYRERDRMLERAAREKFADNGDSWLYVADFTDNQVVISRDGDTTVYAYLLDNGKIVISDNGMPVERQESWVAMIANAAKKFFQRTQAEPVIINKEGDMPLTPEDLAAIKSGIAEAVAPLTERVQAIEANHAALAEKLTADSRAEEAQMREAVKAKFGEVVANSLQGDALKQMRAQIGTAAALAPNSADAGTKSFAAPNPADYFGAAK